MTSYRVGNGLDVHAFSNAEGHPLVLGGVAIPDAPGLEGHSDADVVTHALMDAVLGALGAGDLGTWFGTDDPAREGASSISLLEEVIGGALGQSLVENVDLTIVAQRPRLGPHRAAIRDRLADVLALTSGRVSVKVTSTDGLGAVGRGEGIACWATVLVLWRP